MVDQWRTDLARAVEQGLAVEGFDAVVEALGAQAEALDAHPDAPVEQFRPDEPLLAVVPCEAGYLGVLLDTDGRCRVHVARSESALLDQVRESVDPVLVATDQDGDRDALRRAGLVVPGWFSGSGFSEADLLRACAGLVAAQPRRDGGGASITASR